MSTSANPIILQGTVGDQIGGAGSHQNFRQGYTGEISAADRHARYFEAAERGNTFACVNSAAQALSLTGTTTYTGMIVYNKVGSGRNLVLQTVSWVPTIAETGVGAVILFSQAVAASLPALTATNVSTSPFSTLLNGGGVSAAAVASSCTLAANPIFMRPLIGVPWVTATAQAALTANFDVAGEIIIPPGAGVGIVAVSTALTGIGYMSWEEVSALS